MSVAQVWFRTPPHRWLIKGNHPLKLAGRIEAPWSGNAERGKDILGGTFSHFGHSYSPPGGMPWSSGSSESSRSGESEPLPPQIEPWLHSFDWLSDLAAAQDQDQHAARHLAERITANWLEQHANWSPVAWRPDIIGARLLSWITHSGLVLSSGDMIYRSKTLNLMARQTRHLRANLDLAPPGPARVRAACGMMTAALMLPGMGKRLDRGMKQLEGALHLAINTDGGPITRNCDDAVGMIRDLIILKSAFKAMDIAPPDWLQMNLDKMIPFVRALSHGDHLRAQFNGAYGREMPDDPVLSEKSSAYGRAPIGVPVTGYERVKRWRTCVIIDAAPPPETPLTGAHHAAPLAMEFSDAADRIIVNVGGSPGALSMAPGDADSPSSNLAALSRTTAAHSTLIVGDTNACTLRRNGLIGHGPSVVEIERRENEDGQWLLASHDGYLKRWGLVHRREIFINAAGTDVRGKDTLSQVKESSFFGPLFGPLWGPSSAEGETVHVRFHMAPGLSASTTREGGAVIMRLPHGHGWLFRGEAGSGGDENGNISIEDSLYVPSPEAPQKTTQIVLRDTFNGLETHFRWSFRRLDSKD